MGNLYNENSIESLDPRSFVRLKPFVYCGDTEYATQLLIEGFSNCVDEVNLGNGNIIKITVNDDNTVIIEDEGQGFLINQIRDDGKTVLEAAFSVLNTSGKYREDGTYEGTSLGAFGIGCKLITFLSTKTEVVTYRDKQFEKIIFKDGLFVSRELGKTSHNSGTIITYTPDSQFFKSTDIEYNKIKSLFKTVSCLCKGLIVEFKYKNKPLEIFKSVNGLNDLVDDVIKGKEIINKRLTINQSQGKTKIDLVLTYTSDYSSTIVPYVNTGLTESGPHITTLKAIITKEFNKFFRIKGWLKEKDENLNGEDLQEGLYMVFNITAPSVSYDAQVKARVTSIDSKGINFIFNEAFKQWLESNSKEIKVIADKAILARTAREKARKAKESVRNVNNNNNIKSTFLNLPTKLVDSWSKKRGECELYICEGDSAASGLVAARNGELQAVFPIRGKIISCRKQATEKIYANQEVTNIVKALGLEIDKKTGKLIYNLSKLRYGKIIFAADADPDGQSIKNLLITCFWWLCPELFSNGHIYVAVPPLFRITTKKNEYIYLKDSKELEEYKETHKNEKYLVNRAKGLGEQDAEELEQCLLATGTRNIQKIEVEDMNKADNLLEILMGPSVPPRRDYLLKYGEEANNEY